MSKESGLYYLGYSYNKHLDEDGFYARYRFLPPENGMLDYAIGIRIPDQETRWVGNEFKSTLVLTVEYAIRHKRFKDDESAFDNAMARLNNETEKLEETLIELSEYGSSASSADKDFNASRISNEIYSKIAGGGHPEMDSPDLDTSHRGIQVKLGNNDMLSNLYGLCITLSQLAERGHIPQVMCDGIVKDIQETMKYYQSEGKDKFTQREIERHQAGDLLVYK